MQPAWRPAARDLIRLAPGLRGCCGSVPPSRHIRHVHDANGQLPTANCQLPTANDQRTTPNGHPSPWPPGSTSASAPMPAPMLHPTALRPLIIIRFRRSTRVESMLMTLPLHPQSCSHSATTHRLAMIRPPHITCLKSPEHRSLSAYLSHSHSPAVSSSSAYSPSPSRSPLLVCTLASDLRGGRLHLT